MIAKFIQEYRSLFVCYLLLSFSFLLLFFLYRLPFHFLMNAILLSGVVFTLFIVGLFWQFHNRMTILQHYIDEDCVHLLNKPIDHAYLELINKEKQETSAQLLAYKSREEGLQSIVKMWSHQMKVPLAAISLMSQTGNIKPQDVQHQLMRLEHYLANLLNYLKLNGQHSDFRFEQVEVKEIIIEIIQKYRHQFLQKDVEISIDGTWSVKTDRKWLSFALSQVIDNALKYSSTGGKISIVLDKGISIQDTGIGILPEDIPRLFDEGFTGYNGREHQKATGFGLYLTKRILDQLECDIQVESQVEVGTRVSISKR